MSGERLQDHWSAGLFEKQLDVCEEVLTFVPVSCNNGTWHLLQF